MTGEKDPCKPCAGVSDREPDEDEPIEENWESSEFCRNDMGKQKVSPFAAALPKT